MCVLENSEGTKFHLLCMRAGFFVLLDGVQLRFFMVAILVGKTIVIFFFGK